MEGTRPCISTRPDPLLGIIKTGLNQLATIFEKKRERKEEDEDEMINRP